MNAIAPAPAVPLTGPKLDNRRVLAGIIDLLIVGAGGALILAVAGALGSGERSSGLTAVILGWALYYYFACESNAGQTVGKRVMKLRVLRADGSAAGMREIAVRTVLRVIDGIAFYLVGLVVMLATGQRRGRLGDLAGNTVVADASAAVAPAAPAEVNDEAAASAAATITLPPRPSAAPLPAVDSAPAPPELRPFEPDLVEARAAEEHAVEEPVVAEEPTVAEEPAVAAPAVEAMPADELADPTSPALRDLAHDVTAVSLAPAEPDTAEPTPALEEPAVEATEGDSLTVRSVETVSAIDLVMGGADDGDEGSPPAPQAPAP